MSSRARRAPDCRGNPSTAGDVGFEEAAVKAVGKWRYRPGMQNGRAVTVYTTVVVDFILE